MRSVWLRAGLAWSVDLAWSIGVIHSKIQCRYDKQNVNLLITMMSLLLAVSTHYTARLTLVAFSMTHVVVGAIGSVVALNASESVRQKIAQRYA